MNPDGKKGRRIKSSGIVLILLPVVLGLIRWLTDSDKTVFLILWVFCMFLLAVYLVSMEYFDHVFSRRPKDGDDTDNNPWEGGGE